MAIAKQFTDFLGAFQEKVEYIVPSTINKDKL